MADQPVPAGRAYALQLPERLLGNPIEFVDVGGIPWILELSTGLLCPLEAVCEKVRIPGVIYRDRR